MFKEKLASECYKMSPKDAPQLQSGIYETGFR